MLAGVLLEKWRRTSSNFSTSTQQARWLRLGVLPGQWSQTHFKTGFGIDNTRILPEAFWWLSKACWLTCNLVSKNVQSGGICICTFVPEYKYFCPCVIFFKCIHPLSSAYLYQGHRRGWASIPAVVGKDAGSILPHVSGVRLHANSDGGVEW